MFTSSEIRREHKLSTWKMRTNDSRRGARQCVPITMVDNNPEEIRTEPKRQHVSERRMGNVIIRRF